MFREKYPTAWIFHRNTDRWPFNMHAVPETPGPEPPFKEYTHLPALALPEAVFPPVTLEAAIRARLSCRKFSGAALGLGQLATVLKAGYGVLDRLHLGEVEFLERPVPSGGGLYPLELYLIVQRVEGLEAGIYHYAALSHQLEKLRSLELPRPFLSDLFMGQPYVADSGAVLLLAGVLERSLWKYGDRGYRYILLEAGHAAQNINLTAAALGLGSLNLGGFFDQDLAWLLGLNNELEIPLYGIALGTPDGTDRAELRLAGSEEKGIGERG